MHFSFSFNNSQVTIFQRNFSFNFPFHRCCCSLCWSQIKLQKKWEKNKKKIHHKDKRKSSSLKSSSHVSLVCMTMRVSTCARHIFSSPHYFSSFSAWENSTRKYFQANMLFFLPSATGCCELKLHIERKLIQFVINKLLHMTVRFDTKIHSCCDEFDWDLKISAWNWWAPIFRIFRPCANNIAY